MSTDPSHQGEPVEALEFPMVNTFRTDVYEDGIRPVRYTKECASPVDVEAIRETIRWHSAGLVLWYEIPVQTPFSVRLQREKLSELTTEVDAYALVTDLSRARAPDAETRLAMQCMFTDASLRYVSVHLEENLLVRIAARFVLSHILRDLPHSIVDEREQAIALARHALPAPRASA